MRCVKIIIYNNNLFFIYNYYLMRHDLDARID